MLRVMVMKLAGAGQVSLSTSEVQKIVTKRMLPLLDPIQVNKRTASCWFVFVYLTEV